MLNRLARVFGKRAFEAAGTGKRWQHRRTMPNPNAAITAATQRVRDRSHFAVRNSPWLSSGVSSLVANAVGSGIKPVSEHPDPDVRRALHELWTRWTDDADAAGLTDFYGQQAVAMRGMVESGEAFGRLRLRRLSDGLSVPLQLELLDPTQIPTSLSQELGEDRRIVAGIEFDALGRRAAYHVYRRRLGDFMGPAGLETSRVAAADMIHLFEQLVPGQVRGVSRLASVLLRHQELDSFEDATLVRQKVAALFAGFMNDDPGAPALGQNPDADGTAEPTFEPGTIVNLGGATISFPPTPNPANYVEFVKGHLRAIAAGLGIAEHQVTGDLSETNYSSLRAGLIESRRRVEQLQHATIVFQFCRPVWRRFVLVAALSGAFPARDFFANPEPYYRARFVTPAFEWVDPKKDLEAEKLSLDLRIKSRSESIAARGLDPEAVDEEIAADMARARRLGIEPQSSQDPTPPAAPAPDPDDEDERRRRRPRPETEQ